MGARLSKFKRDPKSKDKEKDPARPRQRLSRKNAGSKGQKKNKRLSTIPSEMEQVAEHLAIPAIERIVSPPPGGGPTEVPHEHEGHFDEHFDDEGPHSAAHQQHMTHQLMMDAARGHADFHDEQHPDDHEFCGQPHPDDHQDWGHTQPQHTQPQYNQPQHAQHPTEHHLGPGMHFIQMIRRHHYKRNGFKDYAKAVRKHRITMGAHNCIFFDLATHRLLCRDPGQIHHPNKAKYTTTSMTGAGQVQAEDIQQDSEYACPVTLGTPGVTLTLDFDTGSSDLWVWSSETRASRGSKGQHQIYNPHHSHTSQEIKGLTWNISYADGSHASGDVHRDVVSIGGVAIPNQAIEVAREMSEQFLEGESDGLLGLAFPQLNTVNTKQKTPMENMIEQGLIREPIFTVKLDKGDSEGFYTFGYMEQPPKTSRLYWTPIDSRNGYWEFRSNHMKFGDQRYERLNNTAILDTGTTLILLHDTFVHIIYSSIPGAYLDSNAGGYVFPTNTRIPNLSFCVGDYLFTIPGKDLAFSDAGNNMSFGAVQSRGGNKQDILGDVFLKYIYCVFDQGKPPRLGVAQRSIPKY